MITLLPRVPAPVAEHAADQFIKLGDAGRAGYVADLMPDAIRYAATGGTRITEHQLEKLRDRILSIATAGGFASGKRPKNFSRFDNELALLLGSEPLFASGEALRDDVWSYMGCFLAPDVVFWRWGSTIERYVGGVRNAFQRLWLRARLFDRGDSSPDRWGLVSALSEDAFLQIIERPGISSDPTLCLAIGEAWVRASKQADGGIEGVTRRAIMEVRVANMVRPLAFLPSDELDSFLDGAFGVQASTDITTSRTRRTKAARNNLLRTNAAKKRRGTDAESVSVATTRPKRVRGKARSPKPEDQPNDELQPDKAPIPAPDIEIDVSETVRISARKIRQLRSMSRWTLPLLTLEKIGSGHPNLSRNEIAFLRSFISQPMQTDALEYANAVVLNFIRLVEEALDSLEAE
jgi:hypothetical protein